MLAASLERVKKGLCVSYLHRIVRLPLPSPHGRQWLVGLRNMRSLDII